MGGFTMIELIVTMFVGAMLLAIGIPALNNFVLSDRDTGQVNSLVSSFNYARSEAVRRNTAYGIEVCPSGGGTTCNAGALWSQGWIVLDLDPNDGAPVLQSVPAFAGSNSVAATGPGATGITFTAYGATAAGAGPNTIITICDSRGAANARDVEVTTIGSTQASQKLGYQVDGVTALLCP
jgi:type IV fimbrial biogenesis protein FimT